MTDSLNAPLVSVLMSCYREPIDQLKTAIGSILLQSYSNLELILVLDDPSNIYAKQCLEAVASKDDRVRLIYNEKNLGLVGSLNEALVFASGDYICRMDADDVSESERIETQLEYLTAGGFDLVGSYMTVIDDSGQTMYQVTTIPTKSKAIKHALKYNNCVPHPSWFGRREVFEDGYRPIPLCEEYDFLVRAALNGFKRGNCPECLVNYRMSANSLSRSNLYLQFLYQKELTGAYRRLAICDASVATQHVESRFSEESADAYARANTLFNRGLRLLAERHLIKGASDVLKSWASSSAYFNKSMRLVIASVCSLVG